MPDWYLDLLNDELIVLEAAVRMGKATGETHAAIAAKKAEIQQLNDKYSFELFEKQDNKTRARLNKYLETQVLVRQELIRGKNEQFTRV